MDKLRINSEPLANLSSGADSLEPETRTQCAIAINTPPSDALAGDGVTETLSGDGAVPA